jgi:serine protease Do
MQRWPLVVTSLALGALAGASLNNTFLQGRDAPAAAPPPERTSYRDVVKKVLPAVVSIEAKARAARPKRRADPPEDRKPSAEMWPAAPDDSSNFGSGVLVDAKGVVLTNYHVVEDSDQVEVQLPDGRKFLSRDIRSDPKTDLAVIRVESKRPLPFLELGDSDAMEIGDRVLAVGAPFRLTGTVTAGIVSAKSRNLRLHLYEDFLQTDAAVNPGNSGGPLVNLYGQVVGINAAIKTRTGGFQGVGLAIASNLIKGVMAQLLKDGAVRRGYLGLQMQDVEDDEIAARLGLKDTRGVVVTLTVEGAPADKGGVRDGDVIVAIAGKPIRDGRQLQSVVATQPLGKPVEVGVVRDGKLLLVKVTIEEQPRDFGPLRVPAPAAADVPRDGVAVGKLGVEAADLTPQLARSLGFKEGTKGALIVGLDRDSPAAEAGLRRGVLITKVDQKPVASVRELKEAAGAGSVEQGVLLRVQSPQTGTGYVLLKAGGN